MRTIGYFAKKLSLSDARLEIFKNASVESWA